MWLSGTHSRLSSSVGDTEEEGAGVTARKNSKKFCVFSLVFVDARSEALFRSRHFTDSFVAGGNLASFHPSATGTDQGAVEGCQRETGPLQQKLRRLKIMV